MAVFSNSRVIARLLPPIVLDKTVCCVGLRFAFIYSLTAAYVSGDAPQKDLWSTFGTRQLEQMLDDRPDMSPILPNDHPVRQWVAKRFNGDAYGFRIYWVVDVPPGGYSDYTAPFHGAPAFVRVANDESVTAVDKWALVVFELHNAENAEKLNELAEQAYTRQLSAEEYATACVRAEFEASLKTAQYLHNTPLPQSRERVDHVYSSLLAWKGTFDEYRQLCKEKGMPLGNYQHYLEWYKNMPPFDARGRDSKPATGTTGRSGGRYESN